MVSAVVAWSVGRHVCHSRVRWGCRVARRYCGVSGRAVSKRHSGWLWPAVFTHCHSGREALRNRRSCAVRRAGCCTVLRDCVCAVTHPGLTDRIVDRSVARSVRQ